MRAVVVRSDETRHEYPNRFYRDHTEFVRLSLILTNKTFQNSQELQVLDGKSVATRSRI